MTAAPEGRLETGREGEWGGGEGSRIESSKEEGRGRERATDVRASLLGDCEWEQLEVREQGRAKGVVR